MIRSFPPSPTSKIRETSGPTMLAVAAIADGEYLKRSGSTIISGTPASGGTPGGSDTEVQVNNSGAFGSASTFTYNLSSGTLSVGATDAHLLLDGSALEATLSGARGVHIDSPGSTIDIGDYSHAGNGTLIQVDDRNQRIIATKKIVCADAIYLLDSGTGTYWRWESISGVWTGTDTASASLP